MRAAARWERGFVRVRLLPSRAQRRMGGVACVESDPAAGLSLRWLHQFALDGKDNVQAGRYIEDQGLSLLLLNGSLHEALNLSDHPTACTPFAQSRLEYSDAYLAFMELTSEGDFTGVETLRLQPWGEPECNRGEAFSGLVYNSATQEVHVTRVMGGPVDHGMSTGSEDVLYMRYVRGFLSTENLGTLRPVDAVRIHGDRCTGCDNTDRSSRRTPARCDRTDSHHRRHHQHV